MDVLCSDPRHEVRNGETDWDATLGTASSPVTGMICRACARLRLVEAQAQEEHANVTLTLWLDGRARISVPLGYEGDELGVREKDFLIQNHTNAAERTTLKAIRDRMLVWLRSQ